MEKRILVLGLLFLAGCSADTINKHADNASEGSVVTLTRTYQRVVRHNCSGQVVSDQAETVGAPVQLIEIPPNSSTGLYSSEFYNMTTGARPKCRVGHSQFYVDYSEGWCNMRAKSGGNQLRYRFYYCDALAADGSCLTKPYLGEEGTTWIQVQYREQVAEGTVDVFPSQETCQAEGS